MRIRTLAAAFLALVMFSTVFAGAPSVTRAATAEATASAVSTTLKVAMQEDIVSLNNFDIATNNVWKANVMFSYYDALLITQPDYDIALGLATSVPAAVGPLLDADGNGMDNYDITVDIVTNATWHDGTALTATDVAFTYQVLQWDSTYASFLLALFWMTPTYNLWNESGLSHVGVEVVDADTVTFHLIQPDPLFYFQALAVPIIPSHIWKDHLVGPPTWLGDDYGGGAPTNDKALDPAFGARPADGPQAAMGSGPFKFSSYVPDASVVSEVYTNYWGKYLPDAYPKLIQRIEYVIYTDLAVASLALEQGDVATMLWSLQPGTYNALKTNPAIGFDFLTDSGFFYLAFNLDPSHPKHAVLNDLAFRQAVSYAIDKDYIVNRLLAGFGSKGTVPVPLLNPAYVNESAKPPEFNLDQARIILDTNGYVDQNGDGWRDAPGTGASIKFIIQTPPKAYDPVRADAGIAIQNNLKAIGLNIDSIPTDFNTIVNNVFVLGTFDMYILGWVNIIFPESTLLSLFHSDHFTPYDSNSPHYSNAYVDALLDAAQTELDNAKRIQYIKDAEGQIVKDLPYNVLYYRKNIYAYRVDQFSGWTAAFGAVWNLFTVNNLGPPQVVTPPGQAGQLRIERFLPANAVAGDWVKGQVFVVDNATGAPVGAVAVEVTNDYDTTVLSGTTDAYGYYEFTARTPFRSGNISFTFRAAPGTAQESTNSATVSLVLPAALYNLKLSSTNPIVPKGSTTTVVATVTDREGRGIAGASIDVDLALLAGDATPASGTTDPDGTVTFTYTPPSESVYLNSHFVDQFRATANVTEAIIPASLSQVLVLTVVNPDYDWNVVRVLSVSDYVIDNTQSTTIQVKVTNETGAAVSGRDVTATVKIPTAGNLTGTTTATTSGLGIATFTFMAATTATENAVIRFAADYAFTSWDNVAILIANGGTGHAGKIAVSDDVVPTDTFVNVTTTIYDQTGAPASGLQVWFLMDIGGLGYPGTFKIGEITELDGPLNPTWFLSLWLDWYIGTTDSNGQVGWDVLTFPYIGDQVSSVTAYVGDALGIDPATLAIIGDEFRLSGTWVQTRAPVVLPTEVMVSPSVITPDKGVATLTAHFVDPSGDAQVDGAIWMHRDRGDSRVRNFAGYPIALLAQLSTNEYGWTTGIYEPAVDEPTVPSLSQALRVIFFVEQRIEYADPADPWGWLWFPSTYASVPALFVDIPYVVPVEGTEDLLVVSAAPEDAVILPGESAAIAVEVTDVNGDPVAGATVSATTSAGAIAGSATTDIAGKATLVLDASGVGDNVLARITVSASLGTMDGSTVTAALIRAPVRATVVSGTAIAPAEPKVDEATTIVATVRNTGELEASVTVSLQVDGAAVSGQSTTQTVAAGGSIGVQFAYTFTDAGERNVTVVATAANTPTVRQSITVDVAGKGLGITALDWGLIAVVVALAAGLAVLLMRRGVRPAAPKPPMGAPPPVRPPAEEP